MISSCWLTIENLATALVLVLLFVWLRVAAFEPGDVVPDDPRRKKQQMSQKLKLLVCYLASTRSEDILDQIALPAAERVMLLFFVRSCLAVRRLHGSDGSVMRRATTNQMRTWTEFA